MLEVHYLNKFKRDVKRLQKQGKDLQKLREVIELLANEQPLPEKYRDHKMTGNWNDFRDCHIEPDWVLIYRIEDNKLTLSLSRTGSHSELGL